MPTAQFFDKPGFYMSPPDGIELILSAACFMFVTII